jgi:hypothetical protein
MMLGRIFAIIALASIASGALAEPISPPPSALTPYLTHGKLLAGDFQWLHGYFPDASSVERANWAEIRDWAEKTKPLRTELVREQLRAMGANPVAIGHRAYGDENVALILYAADNAKHFKSWKEFQAAAREAQPFFRGYLAATEQAELFATQWDMSLADTLKAAALGDQVLRGGMNWGFYNKSSNEPCIPSKFIEPPGCSQMSDSAAKILVTLMAVETEKRDHANTAMMKKIVAKTGWPKISQVGEEAANNAFLLVQHADDDPAFQLQVLRLMRPLVAKHEVAGESFALLSDRVSLVVSGKQRFGSQMTCVKGHLGPQALEDPARLDQIRKSVGLLPMSEYKKLLPPTCG